MTNTKYDEPGDVDAMAARYSRRGAADRYSLLKPDVWQTVQERQRAMLKLFARLAWADLSTKRVVEVGCGSGGNLLELLRVGFAPEHLLGIELLEDRFELARHTLPPALALMRGDATHAEIAAGSIDLVLQSTVFTSLLQADTRAALAAAMWRWVKPGGGVLWYDFTVNNPRNPDVRGVPVGAIRALFPQGHFTMQRVTLAPPIARAVCRIHPSLYPLFNALPPLRTHVLAWIEKPR